MNRMMVSPFRIIIIQLSLHAIVNIQITWSFMTAATTPNDSHHQQQHQHRQSPRNPTSCCNNRRHYYYHYYYYYCSFRGDCANETNDDNDNQWRQQQQQKQNQPPYSLAMVDLSSKWVQLVQDGKVAATVKIPRPAAATVSDGRQTSTTTTSSSSNNNNDGDRQISVRYGVKFVDGQCRDFIDDNCLDDEDEDYVALKEMRSKLGLKYANRRGSYNGNNNMLLSYCAQLQLVRTLRPPPSYGFADGSSTSTTTSSSNVPPTYDAELDSFVVGPLRLQLRPLVAKLRLPKLTTPWDVYHNVSPADPRGHFLLLPTLEEEEEQEEEDGWGRNWRGQILLRQDCHDMVHLTHSIKPAGSMLLAFNSVGAGASQNHIHCHAWPCPPLPFINDGTRGNCYAVCEATEKVKDRHYVTSSSSSSAAAAAAASGSGVYLSLLDYPVFCVKFCCPSGSDHLLDELGEALAATLDAIGDAPFNVGFLNSGHGNNNDDGDDNQPCVVYVFVRSKERSTHFPALKLGISEMMGLFHAQSEDELQHLAGAVVNDENIMEKALDDVSVTYEMATWEKIKHAVAS